MLLAFSWDMRSFVCRDHMLKATNRDGLSYGFEDQTCQLDLGGLQSCRCRIVA